MARYRKRKGLTKGSFASKMYAKGVKRGEYVALNRAERIGKGLKRAKRHTEANGVRHVVRAINRLVRNPVHRGNRNKRLRKGSRAGLLRW